MFSCLMASAAFRTLLWLLGRQAILVSTRLLFVGFKVGVFGFTCTLVIPLRFSWAAGRGGVLWLGCLLLVGAGIRTCFLRSPLLPHLSAFVIPSSLGRGHKQVSKHSTHSRPGMHMQQCSAVPRDH